MKKQFALLLVAVVLLLSGCAPSYPKLDDVDLNMNLAEAGTDEFTVQYPSDEWLATDELGVFMLYDTDETGTFIQNNINIIVSQKYSGRLKEQDMDAMLDELDAMGVSSDNLVVHEAAMKEYLGSPIIYLNITTKITEDMINMTGDSLSPELKEVARQNIQSHQISITASVDGYLIVLTGTYSDDSSKEKVLEAMKILIKTMKITK